MNNKLGQKFLHFSLHFSYVGSVFVFPASFFFLAAAAFCCSGGNTWFPLRFCLEAPLGCDFVLQK